MEKGFLIDYPRDSIYKLDKPWVLKYSDIVNWDIRNLERAVYLIESDFSLPDKTGRISNGLITMDFETFMQDGDIDTVEENIKSCIEKIKNGEMIPDAKNNAGVGRWKE